MYNKLHHSFDSNTSRFYSYQRLAESRTNPHRTTDLITAATIAGRLSMIAAILSKEWDDDTRLEEAAEAVRWCEETAEAI